MKRKLLFAMLCIVSALGLSAQTWTAPTIGGEDPVSGTQYKVMNVSAGQFLTGATVWFNWATSAALADDGLTMTLKGDNASGWTIQRPDNGYTFISGTYNGKGEMHVDGGSERASRFFEFVKQGNGYYHIRAIASDATYGSDVLEDYESKCWGWEGASSAYPNAVYATVNPDEGYACDWAFVLPDDAAVYQARRALYNEYLKAAAEGANTDAAATVYNNASATITELNAAQAALHQARYVHLTEIATADNPVDLTDFVVVNADFSTKDATGWTRTQTSVGNQQFSTGAMESWNNNNVSVLQELTNIPNGRYHVSCDMISGNDTKTAYVYAKGLTEVIGETVSAKSSAADYNTMSKEVAGNTVNAYPVIVGDNKMTIGFKDPSGWVVVDNFKVIYYGLSLSDFSDQLNEVVASAAALDGQVPVAIYSQLNSVVTAKNTSYATPAEYVAAIAYILAAIDDAKPFVEPYTRYKTVKTAVLAISSEISTATADAMFDGLTTVEAIEAATESAVAKLRTDFLTQLPSLSVPSDPGYIDVTDVMVDNASVRKNTNFWTSEENGAARDNNYSWAVCNYDECEFYQQNFKFYQTLAMNVGTWEFGVTGFHRAGNHSTYFYAGEDKILIPGVESSIVDDMAGAKTYFDNGNGQVSLKFIIEDVQDVEIGIDNQDSETDKWTIFRDFTLKYYGPVDYTVYQERWAADVQEAANEAYQNVTGKERDDVNAAIADAPVDGVSKKADYLAKIEALEGALTALKTAAPIYDKYLAYKAETVALWGNDLGVAAPTTAEEAEKAVQELNIAQYNKVANEYSYSLNGLIGDFGSWTGTATVAGAAATPNYLDWEHWSGQQHAYYEQASNGWGNANGWTIQYEKVCKLPAGNYVLKVAARSSAGTTSKVTCSATETTIALPCAGNNTRGINTSGEASWSDDDEFANTGSYTDNPPSVGGTGAGWQWRFLPFTLSEETEVTMTFYAEASTQYQWMSISDGELLSAARVSEQVAFGESKNNTVKDINIADITMSRKIVNGYNTVVLPFSLTANQVTETFGTGSVVYNYSENSADAEKATINFKRGDGSITANVPVLVKATEESTSQWFYGVKIETGTPKVEGKNIDFVGTYSPVTVAADNYFIKGDKLYKSEGKTSIKAFRAYLQPKVAGVRAELFIDGVATAIEAIDADNSVQNGAVYNLAGQRVQKAQRGLYIVNGKKVVIK